MKPRLQVSNGHAPNYNQRTAVTDSFSFGDPEPCLDNRLTDYIGVFSDSYGIYAPPISLQGLVKLLRVNAQHGPILYFKRNMILKWYKPNPLLSHQALSKFAFDLLWSGNAYLQIIKNSFGQVIKLRHLPALTMRYTDTRGVYAQISNRSHEPIYFNAQSALLNEDATLFRRRYYKNGAHMGFIFSMADPNLSDADETALKNAIRDSKGVGNFRSLFFN